MKRQALLALVAVAFAAALALAGFSRSDAGSGNKAIVDLEGCGGMSLPADDDPNGQEADLGFTVDFLGVQKTTAIVNNNGVLSFNEQVRSFTPFPLLDTGAVLIAPYFADVDTRGSGTVSFGQSTHEGRPAFCVNWIGVGYYLARVDKLNSFQLLLVDRSDVAPGDFDFTFNYDQVQWETGDASGGSMGLAGNSARIGYGNGADTAYELPGSAENAYFLDTSATGLIHHSRNSAQNGRYVFQVRGGQVVPDATPTPTPTPTVAATPTRTPTTPPDIVFGDVNCNGSVNSIDAALVLQYGAGLTNNLACLDAADVNENGNVDAIDAAVILQYDAGFIDSLPV